MTDKEKIEPTREFYLITKKAQFSAIEDGIPNLSEADLRRMAVFWIGSHDATLHSFNELKKRMSKSMNDPEIIRQVLDKLPKRSNDLLYFHLSEGGTLSFGEIGDIFPLDKTENISEVLEPLLLRGLVWECRRTARERDQARFHILDSCSEMLPLPSFLEGKYGTILSHRTKEQRYNLVRAFGGDVKRLAQSHTVLPWLKTELRNPARFRRFFDSLEINDRKVLKILSLNDDGLTPDELGYEFTLFINRNAEDKLNDSIKRLRDDLGLVEVITRDEIVGRKIIKQTVYRLPKEAAHFIRVNFKKKFEENIPPIPVFRPLDEDFALGTRGKERPTLWIDFQQLLNHLVRCEVGVIRKGGMHKKNLKRILDRLEGQLMDAYLYLDFLFLYAYQREILYPDGERWKINADKIFAIQDENTFYRDFWAFYRSNGSWNDRDSSPLQGVLQKGNSNQIFALRRAVLRLLNECPVGQWIDMKTFFDQICDRELAFRIGEAPLLTTDPTKEKYRFLKATLERSLSWIGIVDTTTIQTQRINLFRLTEIGYWLLKAETEESPFQVAEPAESITMMPNLEVHIPSGFPLEKQLFLARFTDDQKGRIILNRASIRRGLGEGLSASEMLSFLSDHVQGGLQSNVPHLIEEVSEKAGHVLVGGEPIRIEANNHILVDELVHQKRFLPFIKERSGDKKVLLRRDTDLKKLMEELRKAGYTPRAM
jgi:hypothetical protein